MLRRAAVFSFAFAFALAGVRVARAADAGSSLDAYRRVEVAPAKTSIYVGSVTMTMPVFARNSAGAFESTYVAKVFPYVFYNEAGKLTVELSDEQLQQLARGEPVDFHGRAARTDGAARRVEGRATPTDATTGKLKVRVHYSKRIELIFNTTYRFLPTPSSP